MSQNPLKEHEPLVEILSVKHNGNVDNAVPSGS